MYDGGALTDLNNRLDNSSTGWILAQAQAINDSGWIVGYGFNPHGQQDAFLLTPVPEPSSIMLLVLGGIVVGGIAVLWPAAQARPTLPNRHPLRGVAK